MTGSRPALTGVPPAPTGTRGDPPQPQPRSPGGPPPSALGDDPAAKVAALVIFVIGVVATPITAAWVFAVDAIAVGLAARSAHLPAATWARRLSLETPFLLFALALPVLGSDPRLAVGPIALSQPGTIAAVTIVVKATLATTAAVVLGWTTPVTDVLTGLERLRVPRSLVAIAGFMVRYLEITANELHRLQVARLSRADDPRWLGQGRAVAATAGALFVRSFERGERVAHAMAARGFTGTMPATAPTRRAGSASRSSSWPVLAGAFASLALTVVALTVA